MKQTRALAAKNPNDCFSSLTPAYSSSPPVENGSSTSGDSQGDAEKGLELRRSVSDRQQGGENQVWRLPAPALEELIQEARQFAPKAADRIAGLPVAAAPRLLRGFDGRDHVPVRNPATKSGKCSGRVIYARADLPLPQQRTGARKLTGEAQRRGRKPGSRSDVLRDKPAAVSMEMLQDRAGWLFTPENRKVVPAYLSHRGYIPVRNPAAVCGKWKIKGRRQKIYARSDQPPEQRLTVVRELLAEVKKRPRKRDREIKPAEIADDAELPRDSAGKPLAAVTLALLRDRAWAALIDWLLERGSRKGIPRYLAQYGYVRLRNPAAKDGLWRIRGERQAVYVRRELPPAKRLKAVRRLLEETHAAEDVRRITAQHVPPPEDPAEIAAQHGPG